MRVIDPDASEPVDRGQTGELALSSDGNTGGFIQCWSTPDETARKVQDGWLLTRDLGSYGTDGYVSFHSRRDDVIISSSYRIGPADIEESLATHETVANAGVIEIPNETRREISNAFVVLGAGHSPTDELEQGLQAH